MSDIEFLMDDFKEEGRKELNDIERQVRKKPLKYYKQTIFLRKFILAMMKQYYKPKFKTKQIQDLNLKIKAVTKPDVKKTISPDLPIPPTKLNIDSFMPTMPTKVNLFGDLPTPHVKDIQTPKIKREIKPDSEFSSLNTEKTIDDIPIPKPPEELKVPKPV